MIEIRYTNGEIIVIDLFKNSITEKIIKAYGENASLLYSIGDCTHNSVKMNYDGRYDNLEEIKYNWSQILEGLNGMELLGNKINLQFPTEFDFKQTTLNTLHRIFTYCDLYHSNIIEEYPFCDNYNKDIGIPFEEYHSIIDKINQGVHNLEFWVEPTDNRIYTSENFPLGRIRYRTTPLPTFSQKWCEFTDEEYNENYKFLSYDIDNIVTITDTILGKSPLQSFLDNDNPTLPDCTGRYATDGSFKINKGKELINLYNSDCFKSWASSHQVETKNLPLELAIGYVNHEKTTKNIEYFFNTDLILDRVLMINV